MQQNRIFTLQERIKVVEQLLNGNLFPKEDEYGGYFPRTLEDFYATSFFEMWQYICKLDISFKSKMYPEQDAYSTIYSNPNCEQTKKALNNILSIESFVINKSSLPEYVIRNHIVFITAAALRDNDADKIKNFIFNKNFDITSINYITSNNKNRHDDLAFVEKNEDTSYLISNSCGRQRTSAATEAKQQRTLERWKNATKTMIVIAMECAKETTPQKRTVAEFAKMAARLGGNLSDTQMKFFRSCLPKEYLNEGGAPSQG